MVSAKRRIVIEVMGKDSTKGFRSLKDNLNQIKGLIGSSLEKAMQPNINFEAEMSRVKAITGAVGNLEFKDSRKTGENPGNHNFLQRHPSCRGHTIPRHGRTADRRHFQGAAQHAEPRPGGHDRSGRAADIATNILSGMSLPAEEAQRVIDVMAKAVTSANTEYRGAWARNARSVAPWARAYGVPLEELVTLLQGLANAGIKGADAGMKLRTWMQYMVGPTENMRKSIDHVAQEMIRSGKATEDYNLVFTETDGKLRNLVDVLGELALADIQPKDWVDMFGRRGGTAPAALAVDDVVEAMRRMHEENLRAGGSAANMAEIMDDNLAGAVVELSSAWEGLAISLGEIVKPDDASNA